MRYPLTTVLLLLLAMLAGCGGHKTYNPIEALREGGYEQIVLDLKDIKEFPEEDEALLLNYRAHAKLGLGYTGAAQNDFMRAWNVMNFSQGSGLGAVAFAPEEEKIYLGDPYERMCNSFFLGLVFHMNGKTEDAAACYKNALFVDTGDLKAGEYIADFAPAMIMRTRVFLERGEGGRAQEQLDELNKLPRDPRNFDPNCPWLTLDAQKEANTLIWVEIGWGPFMTAEGEYGEYRVIRENEYKDAYAEVFVNGQSLGQTYKLGDTYFQASTRGGRAMDEVLKDKVIRKKTLTVAGATAIGVGLAVAAGSNNKAARGAGLVAAGVGLGLLIAGALTNPRADVRCNALLPGQFHLMMAKLPPGKHEVEVRYFDKGGRELSAYRQRAIPLEVREKGDSVLLVRGSPRYRFLRTQSERMLDPYKTVLTPKPMR